ncbi:MAG: aldo/keto reductase [Chlorobiota bacterium]
MNINKNKDIVLNNGVEIPRIGLGTYQLKGNNLERAVMTALEAGYRHFDTATLYENEGELGKILMNSGINREDLFITTKIYNDDQGYESTHRAIDKSLDLLQTDFVDLYLIHWPVTDLRHETWEAMIEIYDQRKARSIGVSNYTEEHIDELMKKSPITPVVNQVEMTPFLYQKSLAEKCDSYDIKIQAYSPLARAKFMGNEIIQSMANSHGVTPAQVMIRWSVEKGFIPLPRSSNESRIKENIDIYNFELTENDMLDLDKLSDNTRVSWDPTGVK